MRSLLSAPSLDSDARDVNETRRSGWLESSHLVHRRELRIVQALVRVSSFDNHITLVQLESYKTIDRLLRSGDGSSDEFSLWGEEEPVVQDLGKVDGDELISHGSDVSVQGHTLEVHVGDSENSSSGRLVATSRLDTDESVLDNVDSPNTVLSGQSVEREEDLDGVGDDLAICRVGDLDRETLGEFDLNLLGLFRGVLRRSSQLPHVIGRSLVGVFEDTSFVRNMEQVLIGRPGLGSGLNDGNTVASGVLEESRSTSESVVELGQSPRGNDVDVGGETVECKFESDLVVSFTSATVRDEARHELTQVDGATVKLTRSPLEGQPRSYLAQ